MPLLKVSKPKEIKDWSNKDFVIYFAKKIEEVTGNRMKIEPVAWAAYSGRIKGFRTKLVISNESYKDFIDSVFSNLFSHSGFAPNFGAIVSEKVYYIYKKKPNASQVLHSNFTELRNQLYSTNSLFSRIK